MRARPARPVDSAARRLRQVRWSMTVFFTLATTCCLVILGGFAADANQQARARQSDQQLAATAARLAASAQHSDGRFRFDRDERLQLPPADEPVGFVDDTGIELANPAQSALPRDPVIARLLGRANETGLTVFATAAGPRGLPYRWAATLLTRGSEGSVVLVGAAAADPVERNRFVTTLVAVIGALVLLAGLTGHLLSGIAMRPALQALVRQEQFLREAAHELRTPLAALQMALQTARDADAPRADDALRRAGRRVDELVRLVSWLLLRARSEATAVELRALRLDQVVDVALAERGDDPRVTAELSESVVLGNAELIVHAVRNLVDNAVHHTDGPVRVRVEGTTLSVTDAGPGLEARRPPAGGAGVVGSGSGLPIVHWIAETHRTRLRLDPGDPEGLTASIRFRPGRAASRAPVQHAPAADGLPDASHPVRVGG